MTKRLLNINKRFTQFYFYFVLFYGFYLYIDGLFASYNYDNILYVCFLVILIMKIGLNKIRFFNKISIYFAGHILVLSIACMSTMSSNMFIQFASGMIFLFTIFEMVIVQEPSSYKEKQKIIFMGVIPVILIIIIYMNTKYMTIAHVFVLLMFIFSSYAITFFVAYYTTEKIQLSSELNRHNDELQFKMESLELERKKYRKLNSLMNRKNFEIESQNKILNRLSAELYTHSELLMYISGVLDIEELMNMVTDAIIGAIGVDTCMMVINNVETSQKYYEVITSSGREEEMLKSFKRLLSEGYYDKYFESDKPFMDISVEPRGYPFLLNRDVGSLLITPLITGNITYGLLIVEHKTKNMFDEFSLNFFKGISGQIATVVNNANMYSKMEEMAIRDGLTGLFNRRKMQRAIDEIIVDKNEYSEMTLALFDIDKFKKVNDTYGHLFGDEAIKAIAAIADKYARIYNGIAGRYGGEEFVIALPGKSMVDAEIIIRKFHQSIKNIILIYNEEEKVSINISIGLSVWPRLAKDTNELLSRADNAMYYAKKNGRGRLIIDHEDFIKVI